MLNVCEWDIILFWFWEFWWFRWFWNLGIGFGVRWIGIIKSKEFGFGGVVKIRIMLYFIYKCLMVCFENCFENLFWFRVKLNIIFIWIYMEVVDIFIGFYWYDELKVSFFINIVDVVIFI